MEGGQLRANVADKVLLRLIGIGSGKPQRNALRFTQERWRSLRRGLRGGIVVGKRQAARSAAIEVGKHASHEKRTEQAHAGTEPQKP
jgi:hypothetical protein